MLPDIHRATQKFYIFLIVYLTGCTPVYNTSGHAYLYQMPEGKRLSQKLFLRAMDLQPDSIAHKGDYYWYSDTNFCLRRLDIKDGSTKQILKDKERRVVNVIQVADR